MPVAEQTITDRVNDFYEQMPFNYAQDAGHFAAVLRRGNPLSQSYPNVHTVLDGAEGISVADIGCGTGWFANCTAYHYRLNTTGIDFCRSALDRAAEIARELAVEDRVTFVKQDILALRPNPMYDFVNSLGVLHHTADCRTALLTVCALIKPGGYLHLGLYHKYGREPFLGLFDEVREKLAACGEVSRRAKQEAYAVFRALNSRISDELLLRSWFRDQVLHPHETQHTLREVHQWLAEFGLEVRSTSINQFQPISDIEKLYELEKGCRELSIENNIRRKTYYPGFFTILAQKK
jgi:2-polyprenyl-3-methyl-5-hydroxy-6-metoxy-1,4-benzoquinol methylase